MYTNERLPSIKHQTFKAAIKRLSEHHPGYLKLLKKISIEDSGLHGETYYDQVASKLLSPTCLHLKTPLFTLFKETFQLDSVIITPHFILISEVKNMVGTLYFNQKGGSLTRILNEQKEYFNCPLFQVSRHTECVQHILNQLKIKVPIIDQVIYTNKNVEFIVKDSEAEIYHKIHRIEQFTYQYRKIKRSHPQHVLSESQIKLIYQTLLNRSVLPFWKDYLTSHGICNTDYVKGFLCADCNRIASRGKAGWHCLNCNKRVDAMLYQNVIDCFLLNGALLSSNEIKTFLNLSNNRQVLFYMNKLGFDSKKVGRERIYISPVHCEN